MTQPSNGRRKPTTIRRRLASISVAHQVAGFETPTADAGVRAVVAPGGSIRDAEVIALAQAAHVTMYFTGTRHFAH